MARIYRTAERYENDIIINERRVRFEDESVYQPTDIVESGNKPLEIDEESIRIPLNTIDFLGVPR